MIETDRAAARMTVTSAMLDDDGEVRCGFLLLLAEAAVQVAMPEQQVTTTHCTLDILGPIRGAGGVLLAETTERSRSGSDVVVDITLRSESAGLPAVAVLRHHFVVS